MDMFVLPWGYETLKSHQHPDKTLGLDDLRGRRTPRLERLVCHARPAPGLDRVGEFFN